MRNFFSLLLVSFGLFLIAFLIYASLVPARLGGGMTISLITIEIVITAFLLGLGSVCLGIYIGTIYYGKLLLYSSVFLCLLILYYCFSMPPWVEHIHYRGTSLYEYYPADWVFFVIATVAALSVGGIGVFLRTKQRKLLDRDSDPLK